MIEQHIIHCIAAIFLGGFIRRYWGRDLSTHSLREYSSRFPIRLVFAVNIAVLPFWEHWWNGVIWGAFVAFFYINWRPQFGHWGIDALKRYPCGGGIGYWIAYRFNITPAGYSLFGERWLGAWVVGLSIIISYFIPNL